MNDMFALSLAHALAALAGSLLGLLFYGGLWWTVQRAVTSSRPALWVAGSLLLRMGCAATGLVVVSAGDWRRLLLSLLGFWLARWLVIRVTALTTSQTTKGLRPRLEQAETGPA